VRGRIVLVCQRVLVLGVRRVGALKRERETK
jgi:hypothetical protein